MSALPAPVPRDFSADPSRVLLSEYFWNRTARDPNATPNAFKHFSPALSAFRKFLGDRAPRLAHLTSDTLERLAAWIIDRGRKPATAARIVQELIQLGRAAAAENLLSEPPAVRTIRRRGAAERRPLSIDEIERLLAHSLLLPGDVAGVPAKAFWPALALVLLNMQISAPAALAIPRSGLRRRKGAVELAVGDGFIYAVHPLVSTALDRLTAALPVDAEKLFPFDRNRSMLFYDAQRLFRLAGIPRQRGLSFDRLSAAALAAPTLLDRIDPDRVERLAGEIRAAEAAREQRKADQKRRRAKAIQGAVPKALRAPKKLRQVYTITSDSPRTLRRFFRDVYYPRRLKPFDVSEGTLERYESIFNRLAAFVGAEATLDGIAAPGFLEDVQGWMIATGRSPQTVNSVIAHLQAVLRYARRREFLPQSVNVDFIDKLTVRKKDPVAWSLDEFNRILAGATRLRGNFSGLPYAKLLPAFLLTLFDSALRAGAAIQIRSDELAPDGRLKVDAATQKHKMDQAWPLTAQTLSAIEALDPGSRDMLFAGPHRRPGERAKRKDVVNAWRRLSKALKRAVRIAGVDPGVKPGFHKIRRTSTTLVCAAGGRALAVAHCGHSHESVTDRYIDPRFIERPDAVALLPRPDYEPAAEPPAPRLLDYLPAIDAAAAIERRVQS